MIRGFAAPAAFGLAAMAIPILLMYMLRPRRPEQMVSSTFLWREALENVAASSPWQRIRMSVLLFLQLLCLAALVLTAARPFARTEGVSGRHLILVIDASGSMLATDSAPSRIDTAKSQARDLLSSLADGATVSVVRAGAHPQVLITKSRDDRRIRESIDSIEPDHAASDMAEAFLLAESLESAAEPATIMVLTDGGISAEAAALVPAGALFKEVGRTGDNLAIANIAVEESASGFNALITVRNHGNQHRNTRLAIELEGAALTTFPIRVPASGAVERSVDLGSDGGIIRARIDSDDSLAADDTALATAQRTRATRILLSTPGNVFLQRLLEQIPGARVDVVAQPAKISGYDLVVIDRTPVPAELGAPALFIAPLTAPPSVSIKGKVDAPQLDYIADDPILADVDLSDLAVESSVNASLPADSRLLIGGGGSPLLAVWEQDLRRRAWIGFDLHNSNLPLQVAFPVMMDHLVSWLSGGRSDRARVAGDPIATAAPAGVDRVTVTGPSGRGATLPPGGVLETSRAGIYRVEYKAGEAIVREETIALAFPASESRIRPVGVVSKDPGTRPGFTSEARRNLGSLAAAVALAVLLLEWWWAYGRPRLVGL